MIAAGNPDTVIGGFVPDTVIGALALVLGVVRGRFGSVVLVSDVSKGVIANPVTLILVLMTGSSG